MRSALKMLKLDDTRLGVAEKSEGLRADFIRPGYHWLRSIYEGEFLEVKKALNFCTEEVWEMYASLGEDDLVEVKDLKRALNTFRIAVVSRSRPDYYKLTKRNLLLKKIK